MQSSKGKHLDHGAEPPRIILDYVANTSIGN